MASTRGTPGATISVPVILRGQANVVALQADILFDSSSAFPGAVAPGGAAANHIVTSSEPATGVKRLLCYSLANTPLTNGTVAMVDFTVPAGTSQNAVHLSLSNVVLVTAAASTVASANGNGAIVLNPISLRPDGRTEFFLSAMAGLTNVVQASTNLEQWIDLGVSVPTGTVVEFTDTNAIVFPYRFYRAISRP